MSYDLSKNETEMVNFTTTGDERTVGHNVKLKLSIQEIACLVEDTDCSQHESLPTPPYTFNEKSDEENLIIDIVDNASDVASVGSASVVGGCADVGGSASAEGASAEGAVGGGDKDVVVHLPVSTDINTKIKLLENEIINKRKLRNRSKMFYFLKMAFFYIIILYLFFIPNMIIVFVYHDSIVGLFSNTSTAQYNNVVKHNSSAAGGADGEAGPAGADGAIVNISELINNITDTVNNNIINRLQQIEFLQFRNVVVETLSSTNITSTYNSFGNVDAEHYTGNTFNNCIQGSC